MTKDEIIQTTLRAIRQERALLTGGETGDDDWDDDIVIAMLTERLPEQDFKTCADFGELGVECCHTCHTFSPDREMYIEDLPSESKAWLCCFVRSALRGEKSLAQEDLQQLVDLEDALGGGIRTDTADEPGTP
jgi:hypothetical protein